MITVITRVYETRDMANDVLAKLKAAGFPDRYIDVIGKGAEAQMAEAEVSDDAAAKYAPLVAKGHPLVVVRAPFTPIGAARKALEIVDSVAAMDAGVENEAVLKDNKIVFSGPSSIMPDHPRFLTPREFKPRHQTISGTLGFRTLKPHKKKLSVSRSGRRTFGAIIPLVSKKQRRVKVRHNARPVTGGLFPLLTAHRRDMSASGTSGTVFSDLFGFPTLIRR
jgi:hypothetical protein